MKYDFDEVIDRKNTNSLKYDFARQRGKSGDLFPLWVADMDFRTPTAVTDALKEKAEHGIFGYSEPDDSYWAAVCGWFKSRHGWDAVPENFVITCSVVAAICALIRAVTKAGDAVIICQPVYYPFAESVTDNGRKLVISQLSYDGGYYTPDFEDFERKIVENGVKAFVLCNPHNPVGRVWTKEELERFGDICLKQGVFVISDEIHGDFVYGENKHVVFPTIKREFEDICAVCTAPTKTFNLAGLHIANTYVKNIILREKLKKELAAQGFSQPNIMGLVACRAAYGYGAEWLEQLKEYLAGNLQAVRDFVENNLNGIKLVEPQGTYLLWLDCNGLNLTGGELLDLFENKAKLWVDEGTVFGEGGSGFMRINMACPRKQLLAALEGLKLALNDRG